MVQVEEGGADEDTFLPWLNVSLSCKIFLWHYNNLPFTKLQGHNEKLKRFVRIPDKVAIQYRTRSEKAED